MSNLKDVYEIQDSVWRTIEKLRIKLRSEMTLNETSRVRAKLQKLESAYDKLENAVDRHLGL